MKSFIIAGTQSGVGKTTISIGLMAALRKRGFVVQPFKVGPDFIDPGYHKVVCGRPSYNLDTWMMGIEAVESTFIRAAEGADIGIVEGVMGLFDGRDGINEEGSTAHIAKILDLSIILVTDARSMARSAGALIYGFENFDPELKITGVIFNRVGSKRHYETLKDSIRGRSKVEILGYIPRDEGITIPERHLGLVTVEDNPLTAPVIESLSPLVEKFIDIDDILKISGCEFPIADLKSDSLLPKSRISNTKSQIRNPKSKIPKIAIAYDKAFCFYYQENLDILKELGADLLFFSPMKDQNLPEGTDGIYLGGGYPELYAKELEDNKELQKQIRKLAENGLPIYAECGGFMYLGKKLVRKDGKNFEMVGVFPWKSRMLKNRKSIGYVEVEAGPYCPFLKKGQRIRGHEYHYSEIDEPPKGIKRVYRLTAHGSRFTAKEGYFYKNILASYIHLHFASNPEFARGFLRVCKIMQTSSGFVL